MFKKMIVDPRIRAKHSELIVSPSIVTVQQFTEIAVKEFREDMEKAQNTGQPFIPVIIDSYGGSVYGCLDMVAQIKSSKLPVHTICMGKAMSAGAILFSMGQKRYMAEHATLMLHDAATTTGGKIEEIKADAKECDRLNKLIFRILAQNCGQKDTYFENIIHEKGHADIFMTAKEAKKHKICTHIGVPELLVEVKVKYSFIDPE